ncbi:PucR family transcriptional regulator ligand-binding domain-containing protein [Mycobacterium sp. 21AC1]|uniref:PucR family transcriptional regulator n=1 Tax=[Mycobacterium] appelbergii TaxID=2939269 RepID=UPI0029394F8C|nr:PucR family transcriptional regulator ligand-binding domain-containing protein [Mycobacterium sp. 21AC1]MDV3128439.1 PucR family transcriptional regulator ligand-binding domain-containing protein [Mycobacterium sp. 21AC1]
MTVREALAVPVLRGASPVVVAGASGLARTVLWVHSTELADIGPLLRGGDLVLTTGIGLPDAAEALTAFACSLDRSNIAGLIVELGRRWGALPEALIAACEQLQLPLVALAREVRFAAVAQSLGEKIVDRQLDELRQAQHIHEVFTELSIAEASPAEILESVERLAGAAVVLEDSQHQIVDYRLGPNDSTTFAADWTGRSRVTSLNGRTSWDEAQGWLLTRIGKRERGWGRLIIESPHPPSQRLKATAERAAAALALHQRHARQRDSLIRRTHHELVARLLSDPTAPDVARRCELAGVPLESRCLVGMSIRVPGPADEPVRRVDRIDSVVAAVVNAAAKMAVPAIVCNIDDTIRVLLSIPLTTDADEVANELAALLLDRVRATIGVGRPVRRAAEADRTLREALHVLNSLRPAASQRMVYRLEDVRLRGLLSMLADDDRLRLFCARELGPLKEHDAERNGDLLATLRAFVRHPTSKSDAAAELHMSRSAFYDRLARITSILDVDLEDPDINVSLHVALVAEDVLRGGKSDEPS